MPDEAQLKAQIQAAIAKKKQAEQVKAAETPKVETIIEAKAKEEVVVPTSPAPAPVMPASNKPFPEEKTAPSTDRRPPVVEETPVTLTFFGQAIRFTTHRGEVYFAVDDVLPLSNNPEAPTKYVEFKNRPSTKSKAESLIKTLTFAGENGTEKLDGAKAKHIIEILRELELSSPGPLSRWLDEISSQYKTKDDKSEE